MSSTAAADPTAADPAANPVAGPAAETLSRHLRRAVPRYTSYPTAPHFHPGVGAETYLRWLAETPTDAPISLYVHIPFCHALCWYCGCNMKLAARYAPVAAYVDGLLAEIALIADAAPARLPVGRVHFGGGTPTALRPDDLERVTAALRARFDIRDDAEIAIEGDSVRGSPS
ncbi:MAG: radical SAM protein, partial [Pseudomonadota bacterium]